MGAKKRRATGRARLSGWTTSFFLLTILLAEGCSGEAGTAEVTFSPVPPAATAVVPSPAVDAYERNARLGRGVNLGNALEAPQEGEWGVVLQEEYFDLIAEAGFDSVRIPIRWSAHAEPDAPYTIDPVFFMRVDWAVDQALSRGLLVVLNIHHYEEIMENPQGQRERFLALWEQIASHYQGYSLDLLFELLNEPMGELTEDLWNEMLGEALDVVRQTNPQRDIIVGPVNWNSLYALHGLELPEDRHIIVAFHSYDPFEFTHQGAEWVSGSEAWLGTTWEGSLAQERAITRAFDLAAVWAEAHDRPLTLGEFGAYSKADMESRALWTAFVARQAEARGMSWAYWEFCAGFGVYDASRRTWNEPILEALLLSRATLFERRLARLNGLDGRRKEALAGLSG